MGQRGLTLVEVMISLVLGLILIGGVLNIFVSNRATYRATENLTRIQENVRSSFDFMARDLREVGQNPCGTKLVANVIRNAANTIPWWADWNLGTVIGIDGAQDRADIVAFGTGTGARVSGTDAIVVIRAEQDEKIIASHNKDLFEVTLNSITGLAADDVVVGCDLKAGAIFQIGTINTGAKTISYDPDFASLNCRADLVYPTPSLCPITPLAKTFDAGGMVSKLTSAFWYVGYTASGKRSLYRTRIIKKTVAGVPTITTEAEEMITGVQDLQIAYLTTEAGVLASDWVSASDGTSFPGATSTTTGNWRTDDSVNQPKVTIAVRITLTLQSEENVGTNQQPIQRQLIHVVSLRSRETL
jgi:type IV pilus assembly protein PilW